MLSRSRRHWQVLLGFLALAGCSPYPDDENRDRKGFAVFWTGSSELLPITVVVDGVTIGRIEHAHSGAPECSHATALTATLSPGSHEYEATSAGGTWQGEVDVTSAGCSSVGLMESANEEREVCGGMHGGNLVGTWRRAGDFGAPDSEGMVVEHRDGQGVIVANPGLGYRLGDVKWRDFDPSTCEIQSLFSNRDYNQEFRSSSLSLNADETQLTIGSGIYHRE